MYEEDPGDEVEKNRVLMATPFSYPEPFLHAVRRVALASSVLANYEYFMLNQCLENIGGMHVFLV
jgi:hypothetical protein